MRKNADMRKYADPAVEKRGWETRAASSPSGSPVPQWKKMNGDLLLSCFPPEALYCKLEARQGWRTGSLWGLCVGGADAMGGEGGGDRLGSNTYPDDDGNKGGADTTHGHRRVGGGGRGQRLGRGFSGRGAHSGADAAGGKPTG